MKNRREFIRFTALSAALLSVKRGFAKNIPLFSETTKPIVISTWNHGVPANAAAWKILSGGGRALDAVEAGVRIPEADPKITSVGYGGLPDRDGRVTLDACIMDEFASCGSVAFLEHIMHPISVARLVMEKTSMLLHLQASREEFSPTPGVLLKSGA